MEEKSKKPRRSTKIIILSLTIIILIVVYFIYANVKYGITIAGPSKVYTGESYKYTIKIKPSKSYSNSNILINAPLSNNSKIYSHINLSRGKVWSVTISMSFYFAAPIVQKNFENANYIKVSVFAPNHPMLTSTLLSSKFFYNLIPSKQKGPTATSKPTFHYVGGN